MPFSGANVSNVVGVTAPMQVSTIIGVTTHVSVSTKEAWTHSDLVASMPPPMSFPITLMVTNPINGNSIESRFSFLPQLSLPMFTKEYSYGMPTSMMTGL